ncbi:MAG: vitamin B12-dependent ribonucleotide reductase [Candidatus Nephthysia bennettiae]|uniref:Vitamin B12-dependent ribonucleotide reductase n=1 Tax=Candidatus Nephthysia bennettiae TaxID=3127016 RepID=A0A934K7U6_9BACT|nr:vitamin B12-dependent ribonucleotide reductase [Candidatus Dormibacteraeota bacterium]MBJ7611328.1 vitamin B12-dependent ribonucleotide reductase [Candidatus Dormibacteraeota bacterium]PZR97465.1 MAG: vitamin B12-dependent ribonucleotide reductase [Candidatus Dormibacteraeota bacterium]
MAKNVVDVAAGRSRQEGNGAGSERGLQFERYFTPPESSAYDLIEWDRRTASITSEKGTVIFEQKDVEVPSSWSQLAINVVAQKYFRGHLGSPDRESSVQQLVDRVVDTLARWGVEGGYFATEPDAANWSEDLRWLLATQHASFNSPVWFNIGVAGRAQQASACFINSVQDTMESILELVKTEGMLFKFGSGTGTNLSVLRSSKESLAGGGTASGPVSFMRGYDSFAGSIKSGGTTRRAAKMVILNADHPDILEFVGCKAEEEKKAWALIEAGFEAGFNVPGGAYDSVQFQNANHSVRVTDEFMRAVEEDADWLTHAVTDGRPLDRYQAREVWKSIAEAAWICGDPGLQFDTTIQDWNCVPGSGRINATNPCSEFVFVDDTACNLLSLNLMKFQDADGRFDVDKFQHAIDVTFTAQEILVSNASYPTPGIAKNSERLRPLGLGYANLGALLMSLGLAYDSDEGRSYAAGITGIMTGRAYAQSSRMAAVKGPFADYEQNREAMLAVIGKHRAAAHRLTGEGVGDDVVAAARTSWDETLALGEKHGYRNAQATVLAPTGTIGLMMDCDTTGIEPDLALVKYKKLVGGGLLKMVNSTVPQALRKLGYGEDVVKETVEYIDEHDTIEGAPNLQDQHLKVFDCAFKPVNGQRSIAPMGHVRMMAAVQPFISGSQSKTVNMPTEASVEDIAQTYMESWKLGLKCIAIYRDGCKRSQPLSTSMKDRKDVKAAIVEAPKETSAETAVEARPVRRRLPDERQSLTHKFDIQGHEGYITVGLYPDGTPGEIFLTMAKEGSTISGLMDAFATQTSLALQYGVPLRVMVNKFSHMRFEPNGFTRNPEIPMAKSLIDYIYRWLASRFLDAEDQEAVGIVRRDLAPAAPTSTEIAPAAQAPASGPRAVADTGNGHAAPTQRLTFVVNADAPACSECGSITVRSGACYKCMNCGATTGCS